MRSRIQSLYIKDINKVEEIILAKLDINDSKIGKLSNKPTFKGDKKVFITEEIAKAEEEKRQIVEVDPNANKSVFKKFFGFSSSDVPKVPPKEVKTFEYYAYVGGNIYFSDNGVISDELMRNKTIKPLEKNKVMSMSTFLGQMTSIEDINNLELYHMLDIDYEKLEQLKKKSLEFIEASSNLNYDQVLMFFNNKLQELRQNDINLQIFIQNIDRVRGIRYEKDGVKVYFKK